MTRPSTNLARSLLACAIPAAAAVGMTPMPAADTTGTMADRAPAHSTAPPDGPPTSPAGPLEILCYESGAGALGSRDPELDEPAEGFIAGMLGATEAVTVANDMAELLALSRLGPWDLIVVNPSPTDPQRALEPLLIQSASEAAPLVIVAWEARASAVSIAAAGLQKAGYTILGDSFNSLADPAAAGLLLQSIDKETAQVLFVDSALPDSSGIVLTLLRPVAGGGAAASPLGPLKDLICALRATLICAGAVPGCLKTAGHASTPAGDKKAVAACSMPCLCCCECLPKVWNLGKAKHCHACDGCITCVCDTIWCKLFKICSGCGGPTPCW